MFARLILSSAFSGLLICAPAHAEFPLSTYDDLKDDKDFKSYMTGVARGVFWANAYLDAKGQPRLFCFPPKLGFDAAIALSVLNQAVLEERKMGTKGDASLELILTSGLSRKFPCESPKEQN